MLRRFGNKSKLLPKLLPLFPENITTFIDMFMGSGSVTFAMVDRCKYVIANDNDAEIYNLFMVVKEHKQELLKKIRLLPEHESIFTHWCRKQESDDIWKAVRFLALSNLGYLGKDSNMSFRVNSNHKQKIYDGIEDTFNHIHNIKFMASDFRGVLSKLSYHPNRPNQQKFSFVYADPPYIGTNNNYAESFTEDDTRDLFSILTGSGLRFAVSEFRHPLVMALAEEHGLYVTSLGERRNLKNRREEVLITNYKPVRQQIGLFDSVHNNGLLSDPNRAEQVSFLN